MEAVGPVLIVISIPLILRWIPPNYVYGFRVAATLRNRSVWYDVNALAGRHFALLGLFLVLLEFTVPEPVMRQTLRLTALVGLAVIVVMDWRTANRWEREHAAHRS